MICSGSDMTEKKLTQYVTKNNDNSNHMFFKLNIQNIILTTLMKDCNFGPIHPIHLCIANCNKRDGRSSCIKPAF